MFGDANVKRASLHQSPNRFSVLLKQMPQIVKTIAKLIRGSCDGLNGVVSTKNKQPTTKNKQLTTRPQSINNSFGVSVFFEASKVISV